MEVVVPSQSISGCNASRSKFALAAGWRHTRIETNSNIDLANLLRLYKLCPQFGFQLRLLV